MTLSREVAVALSAPPTPTPSLGVALQGCLIREGIGVESDRFAPNVDLTIRNELRRHNERLAHTLNSAYKLSRAEKRPAASRISRLLAAAKAIFA